MPLNLKKIGAVLSGMAVIEIVSLLGYLIPAIRLWTFAAVAILFLILALRNFRLAVFVLLAELFIGSKGYLFYLEFGGINLSVRIVFFLIIIAVWSANFLIRVFVETHSHASLQIFKEDGFFRSKFFYPYLALLAAVIFGIIRGVLAGNASQNIFFDANGYFYLALAPIFYGILKTEEGRRDLFNFLFAAAIWVSAKTLFLLAVATHLQGDFFYQIYRWVRTTGIGEITPWSGGFYRVFIQSQIYVVFALLIVLAGKQTLSLFQRGLTQTLPLSQRGSWRGIFIGALFFSAIFVSLSRSFEVGLVAAIVTGLVLLFVETHNYASLLKFGGRVVVMVVFGFLLAGLISPGFFGAASGRAGELGGAAANTRLAELPPIWEQIKKNPLWGSGFGATLTFKSSDPRVFK
ncbi:MAG: hypothetical protein AAB731_01830 [Patescibacteria group bacterium]